MADILQELITEKGLNVSHVTENNPEGFMWLDFPDPEMGCCFLEVVCPSEFDDYVARDTDGVWKRLNGYEGPYWKIDCYTDNVSIIEKDCNCDEPVGDACDHICAKQHHAVTFTTKMSIRFPMIDLDHVKKQMEN